jgi:hypothetical protein
MSTPRVYADFNNLDDYNRLRLTCAGTIADLSRQGIELREGLTLTFYMDDADDEGKPDELLAEGVVHYHAEEKAWVATVDWSAVRHASDAKDPSPPTSNSPNGIAAPISKMPSPRE